MGLHHWNKMTVSFILLFVALTNFAIFTNAENSEVTPEFLDELLEQQRYEEFSHYMGIENPDHVRPNAEIKGNPMFNPDLDGGDIMVSRQQKELQRQGVRNTRYRWPNRYIPIVISNQFSSDERRNITRFAINWNRRVSCVRLRWRRNEADYVNFIKGNGCWSYLGRSGGAQSLSLGNGCIHNSVFGHEMMHAVGFIDEHNRPDRDDYIEILWNRIPEQWHGAYRKADPKDVEINGPYDFYTNMHRTYDGSYRIKNDDGVHPNVDRSRVGRAPYLTDTDVQKINNLYGCTDL